jgi:NitT/TauT family transport system substrate-binding protein
MTPLARTIARIGGLTGVLALVACTGEPKRDAPGGRVKFRVASQSYISHSPLFIGIEDSLFAAQGIDVEVVPLMGTEALPLLLTSDIDAITATLPPGALNAMAAGQSIRIVAARGVFTPERCSVMPISKRTTPARSRTRTTISIDRDLAMQYLVEESLRRAGVAIDTMQVLFANGPAELESMRQGTLDYALTGEPWATRARREGHSTPWISLDSLMPGAQHGYVLYGPSILERNRPLGERFLTAYLEATRRFMRGPDAHNLAIVSKVTREDPEVLRDACWPTMSTDGRIVLSDVEDVQRWGMARKYMQKAATPAQYWDSSFVVAAERSSARSGGTQ